MAQGKNYLKRGVVLLCALVLVCAMAPAAPASAASRSIAKLKAAPVTKTGIRVSWKKSSKVRRWKICIAKTDRDGNAGKYRKVRTLSGSASFTRISGLKYGKEYSVYVAGYTKKKGHYKKYTDGDVSVLTGVRAPEWADYAKSDPYCGPDRINLQVSKALPGGFRAEGYEIWRKAADSSEKYSRITTLKPSGALFRDKTVKAGVTYKYRLRAYCTYKGKRMYSGWSETLSRSAVNQEGKFTITCTAPAKLPADNTDTIELKVESGTYNGLLQFGQNNFILITQAEKELASAKLTDYSSDGVNWKSAGKDGVQLKGDDTLWLRFRLSEPAALTDAQMLYAEDVLYIGLPSVAQFSLSGKGTVSMNAEFIH